MARNKIRPEVSLSGVQKSGRHPRRFDGYRDSGWRGDRKGRTLRDFRKGASHRPSN